MAFVSGSQPGCNSRVGVSGCVVSACAGVDSCCDVGDRGAGVRGWYPVAPVHDVRADRGVWLAYYRAVEVHTSAIGRLEPAGVCGLFEGVGCARVGAGDCQSSVGSVGAVDVSDGGRDRRAEVLGAEHVCEHVGEGCVTGAGSGSRATATVCSTLHPSLGSTNFGVGRCCQGGGVHAERRIGGGLMVSERTLANRKKRQAAKARKQRKRVVASGDVVQPVIVEPVREVHVPEWRQKGVDGRQKGRGAHVGQFADLSDDVQRRLKESRARALIAKNEREEREHRGRISDMDSPEAIFMKAMGLMEIAQRAAKSKNNSRVMGWVETVASSHAESLAKSAPNSLPSYASVCAKSVSTGASSVSVDGTRRQRPVGKVISTVFDGATPYTIFSGQIAAAKDTITVALLRADLKKNKMGLSPQEVSELAVLVNDRMEAVRPHNEFGYDY